MKRLAYKLFGGKAVQARLVRGILGAALPFISAQLQGVEITSATTLEGLALAIVGALVSQPEDTDGKQ